MSWLNELRDGARWGKVVELAIGASIGAATGAIVTSLVDVVLMPMRVLLSRQIDLSNLFVVVGNPNSVPVASFRSIGPSERRRLISVCSPMPL